MNLLQNHLSSGQSLLPSLGCFRPLRAATFEPIYSVSNAGDQLLRIFSAQLLQKTKENQYRS